jgi:hypothetical protein
MIRPRVNLRLRKIGFAFSGEFTPLKLRQPDESCTNETTFPLPSGYRRPGAIFPRHPAVILFALPLAGFFL